MKKFEILLRFGSAYFNRHSVNPAEVFLTNIVDLHLACIRSRSIKRANWVPKQLEINYGNNKHRSCGRWRRTRKIFALVRTSNKRRRWFTKSEEGRTHHAGFTTTLIRIHIVYHEGRKTLAEFAGKIIFKAKVFFDIHQIKFQINFRTSIK